ncbi:MAG: hypothetical protein ABDH23_02490 [Endomicrobiia bacterium]
MKMFHVKQTIKLFIFQMFFYFIYGENFEKFFKTYSFVIFSGEKEVGFINVSISSFVSSENVKIYSEIDSYADIPILFFMGKTKNYEIEEYNFNDLTPLNSMMLTIIEGKKEIITVMENKLIKNDVYECKITKKEKKTKEKKFEFKYPILTAGNAIPLVSTLWDFEKINECEFNFIDKEKMKIEKIKLYYLGREKSNHLHKIKLVLPYLVTFFVYLDDNKNIVYAEGIGLKIKAKN